MSDFGDLWDRVFKKKIQVEYMQTVMEAVARVEAGDRRYLYTAYWAFVMNDEALVRRAGGAIRGLLETYTIQQMVRLSERFRQYTSLEWYFDWDKVDLKGVRGQFESDRDYVFTLILGSFHPNGYYRERCTRELAEYQDTLPYMVLRVNDWVEVIRQSAFELVKDRLSVCSVAACAGEGMGPAAVCDSFVWGGIGGGDA